MSKNTFFGIGVYHLKHECNQGTLWRSAYAFGASLVFTVGQRFVKQAADTPKTYNSLPMFNFVDIKDLIDHLPYGCPLVGVENRVNGVNIKNFIHPPRCCYLLGAEDHGLPPAILQQCHKIVEIPNLRICLNVSTAGSIIMYDRARSLYDN